MDDPSYYLWHPTLVSHDGRSAIFVNVTPTLYQDIPAGPLSFFTRLLADIDVPAQARGVTIVHTRCPYNGWGDDASDWRDAWPLNWQVFIDIDPEDIEYEMAEEYYETEALGGNQNEHAIGIHAGKTLHSVGCLIIADFRNAASAEAAKREIGALRLDRLSFLEKRIGRICVQVQIHLGDVDQSYFQGPMPEVARVHEIIARHGGLTSFDRRANEWDEL